MPSTYFSRLRTAIQNGFRGSIVAQEGVLQGSIEIAIRQAQGKFQFCTCRLFHSVRIASLTDLQVLLRPGTVFAASSDSQLVDRRRNISVIGAISRTFSIHSVSSPSFQVCGYHIDRALCDTNPISVGGRFLNKRPMAACSSRAIFGERFLENLTSKGGHLPLSTNNASISYGSSSSQSCRKFSMSLKNQDQPTNSSIYGYFVCNVAKRWYNFSPYAETVSRDFHSSSRSCFSAGTAPDVTYDNSAHEEQAESSAVSSEQYVLKCFHHSLFGYFTTSFQCVFNELFMLSNLFKGICP